MAEVMDFLRHQLEAGAWTLGQIQLNPGIVLRHIDDADSTGLEIFTRPEDARALATYDDAGNYRPLKTAPNLRHGWELRLATIDDLRLALDFFYPAAIGTWLASLRGELTAVPLRETLGRQTGMYRVTQRITDEQARGVIQNLCVAGCLRHRLWTLNRPHPIQNPKSKTQNPEVLCVEACNLFVAACRPLAKENLPAPKSEIQNPKSKI
jgi:sirohydrochlorin cobaltochelatase